MTLYPYIRSCQAEESTAGEDTALQFQMPSDTVAAVKAPQGMMICLQYSFTEIVYCVPDDRFSWFLR